MIRKIQLKALLLIAPLIILGIVLSACGGGADDDTQPLVSDPDAEINVTPQPTDPDQTRRVHFTVKVVRIGDFKGIGWWSKGELYVYADVNNKLVDPKDPPLLAGTGFGMAGYDASGGPCTNLGGWPVDYEARGTLNPETCEMKLSVIERWPYTEAHATCLGYSAEVEAPPYEMVIQGIHFTETHVKDGIPLTKDEITWMNTFTLIPGMNTEVLNCMFSDPPAEEEGE